MSVCARIHNYVEEVAPELVAKSNWTIIGTLRGRRQQAGGGGAGSEGWLALS